MDCNTCKERQKQAEPIPFIAYESGMARMERTNKRLWVVVIILIVALIASNAVWIYYESQFTEEITETYTSESDDGGIAIVNRDGEVNYGEGYLHPNEKKNP